MARRRRRAILGDRGFPPRPRARGPPPCIPIPVAGEPKKNACEMASHSVLANMPAALI